MAVSASLDIDSEASHVVTSAWPDTFHLKDVAKSSDRDPDEFHSKFPGVTEVLVGLGTPVQGSSAAEVSQRCAEGKCPNRCWDEVDLGVRLQLRFPYGNSLGFGVQVASARGQIAEIMSKAVDLRPAEFDATLVTWVARPQRPWCDWVIAWPAIAQSQQTREREVVWWPPGRGACSEWLRQGSRWQGEAKTRPLLTYLRWIPRDPPPSQPHWIHACNKVELAGRASGPAASPAQFKGSNGIHNAAGGARLCTMNERERLLDLPEDGTLAAVKSGAGRSGPGCGKACRLSPSGNAWSVPTTALQVGSLLVEWAPLTRLTTEKEVALCDTGHLLAKGTAGARRVTEGGARAKLLDDVRFVLRQATRCKHTGQASRDRRSNPSERLPEAGDPGALLAVEDSGLFSVEGFRQGAHQASGASGIFDRHRTNCPHESLPQLPRPPLA